MKDKYFLYKFILNYLKMLLEKLIGPDVCLWDRTILTPESKIKYVEGKSVLINKKYTQETTSYYLF